jgi:hypothetical protein
MNDPTIVTVVTLYDDDKVEHYVGVVLGKVTDEQRAELAKLYNAVLEVPEGLDDESPRVMYFAQVEAQTDPAKLMALLNIDGEYPTARKSG